MFLYCFRSLLLAAFVLSNCITWTTSRHHYSHNVSRHRSRHRRQGKGLFLSASYVLPGGEGDGWGEWGETSPCSRTCGGGVASQTRICLKIGPDDKPQCTGGDTRYISCETQDCPDGSKDFREQQCSEYDDIAFRDIKYKWVPYTKAPNPCQLNCMPRGERFYYRHKEKVVDGTRCDDESFNVCVNGTCQPVGCDMMLGSSAREDKCRVCRGNGVNCRTTTGIDTQEFIKGYNDVLLIPEGATTIIIQEIAPSDNYLALRAQNGTFYLNGDYHIDFPRSLMIAGALWYYERSQQGFAAPDKLRCLGPTNEPLLLSLLLQGDNVGIQYEYSLPKNVAPPQNKEYNWVHDDFGECSATCGGGFQTRNVTCRSREELEIVDEGLCVESLKPPTNQTCNTQACAPQWVPRPWGQCSKRCGKGGTRSREVHCEKVITNGYSSIVEDKECFDLLGPKPELYQECNENATCPSWFTGPWKPCNRLCDEGKQTRQVVCYQKNGRRIEVFEDSECEEEKPAEEQTCFLEPCEGVDWVLSDWSGCDSCLSTIRSRVAICSTKAGKVVNESLCAYHPTPDTQEPCDKTKLPPCEVQWYATQWSKCSVECGKGVQTRKVFCGLFDGASVLKVDDNRCTGQTKYNDTKTCEIPQSKCPSQWFAGPWSECTKKCGGGEQYRRVICLRGGVKATDCKEETNLPFVQTCHIGPCNEDELLPADDKSTPVMDDYDDCEEEDSYPEVGLDALTTDDLSSMMFSDSPSEGSGEWSTSPDFGLESEFIGSTLSVTDLEGSGTGSTSETFITDDYSTDTSETDTTTSEYDTSTSSSTDGSTDSSTESETTDSTITESTETDSTKDTEATGSDSTTENVTSDGTEEPSITKISSSDLTASGSTELTETGSTEPTETGPTETTGSSESTTTGSTESTETDTTDSTVSIGSTESTESNSTESTNTSVTEAIGTGSTEPTETGTTDSTGTGSTETTESGTTDATGTDSTETTETGSTEPTETDSTETTETGTTDATETTETGSTESTGTDSSETTETGSTETTESGTTEPTGTGSTESTESGTTEPTGTSSTESTESGTTEPTGTSSTETTDTGSTEPTGSTETTESGTTEPTGTGSSETTESGTTEPTGTGSSETTETGSTETTESGTTEPTGTGSSETTETDTAETTESGSTETGTTEPTETGSTETTETGSTETTETGSTETTETGSTETTETGSTETTESGATETTDISSTTASEGTESTTTESSSSDKTTGWDLSSTIEEYTTKKARVCRPRSCINTKFGCCPDKKTTALGPFDDGCPKPETCKDTKFGCCPDKVSPAKGPKQQGCPTIPCEETLFGCCQSDNKTAAKGNDEEGCPPPPPACKSSKFGCCKDGETQATGPAKKGCPETVTAGTTEATTVSTTTVAANDSCAASEFGCCSDNKTLATGPKQEGCPCAITEFGCCPDGVTPAPDAELAGCPKACNSSTFGCCPYGDVPAHGPDYEGCCLLYPFGCCPDNFKPANGPHLEGCGCQESRYGCCPDNQTIATGPNNKGCGCQYSEHGCCPDRHTEASGPEFEGCGCHTYQFGCCPDGVTIAQGPSGLGCHCIQSKFGCCGDGETHATGPKKQGCDCSTSKFGCCPDGVTEASGTKFLGCADKPEIKQASCNLPFERGTCRNYSVYWFFDNKYGGCSRFWYGGCEGNGNRFPTKEECEDTCISPPPKETCQLPQSKGACLGYNIRWYYDTEREMCSNFVYGGCLGNKNNFETREACQAQCEPDKVLDQCSLPIERGSCAGTFPRWAFDKESKNCKQFTWGGCEGNSNRFKSEAACLQRCDPPGQPKPECYEKQDVGNCSDKHAAWSFSQSENRCVPFYYTGCNGNGNNFYSLETCEETCPSAYVPELCTLPAETGDCANYREKWYYNTKEMRCMQFYYGGCGGNGNNFNSELECERSCSTPPPTTTHAPYEQRPTNPPPAPTVSTDLCQQPMSIGSCEDSQMLWFYDAASDTCSKFTYSGCGGNDNRFESRDACERRCRSGPVPEPATTTIAPSQEILEECRLGPTEECVPERATQVWVMDEEHRKCVPYQNLAAGGLCRYSGVYASEEECERACGAFRNIDVCRYTLDVGPCQEYVSKYHYNATSGRCEEFAYGGCLGGPNRFSTDQECMQICGANSDPCKLPVEPGNCIDRYIFWYYDETRDDCSQFVYGGCGGNANRFETREECDKQCKREPRPEVVLTTTTTTTTISNQVAEECVTPSSLSPCSANVTAFYYDSEVGMCRVADHGGCGYVNTYSTEEECERRCGAFKGIDVCAYALNAGPCQNAIPKFYFDSASGLCKQYDYGGCEGGPNRFSTESECQHVCGNTGPAPACLEPPETGSSRCGAPSRRWHYSVARADCLAFAFEGCDGNDNNFWSYEECAALCRVPTRDRGDQTTDICEQYTQECMELQTRCLSVNRNRTPEGCYSCTCACAKIDNYCASLECKYGLQRSTAEDGCPMCSCYDDPCERSNCPSGNKCVAAAFRDPNTHEVQYSAHCVPDIETNEIVTECEELEAECARLECAYGVQRTHVSGGCERCTCVPEEVNCAPLAEECQSLKCNYGMHRTTGPDGCERCKCLEHPCAGKDCPEGERCVASPYRDPITLETEYTADCRPVTKPGSCPAESRSSSESVCRLECHDDADCRGVGKCCAHGCSQLCLVPEATTSTVTPDEPRAPQPSKETEPEVVAAEGGKASLRCLFHGNPPPKITWKRGEITIDSDVDRYRLMSDGTLEIVSLYRNDSGVYICIADNGLGIAKQEIILHVNDPVRTSAGIAGEPGAGVLGELGQPQRLRCLVYGYPEPAVFWYRGLNGPMVPLASNIYEYEERGRTLLIRRLEVDTLGEYACVAYNAIEKPATWLVVVRAPRPEGLAAASPYLLEGATQPPPPLLSSPTTPAPTPEPTTLLFTAPVETNLRPASTTLRAGEELSLPCEVDGYPEPQVYWTKDGVRLLPNDRMWITNTRLVIQHAMANDSGLYGCHASNGYSSHESKVSISVRDLYIPSKCTDSPYFANCALIVQSKFCKHKYYSRFCCKSCVEAGLLDPSDIEMQGDAPFRKK